MDEPTLVRELRADIDEPDPAAVAAARRRLRAVMSGDRIPTPRRRRPVGIFVPVAAALAVVAVVAGLALVPRLVSRVALPAADPAASALLEGLAQAAERQPDPGPPGDRVWYLRTVDANRFGGSAERRVEEVWATVDGPRRDRRCVKGEPTGLDPTVRDDRGGPGSSSRLDMDVSYQEPGAFFVGQDMFPWSDLLPLPSDPRALRRELPVDRYWTEGPGDLGELLGQLLPLPLRPAQRAAMLRLLATVPGLVFDGPVEGPEGVRGEAVTIPLTASTHDGGESVYGDVVRLIFDPRTGRLMARVGRLVHPDEASGAPAGAVVRYEIFSAGRYLDRSGVEFPNLVYPDRSGGVVGIPHEATKGC